MISQRYVWNLVAKKLSCEASNKELAELELLMEQDLELYYSVQVMEAIWNQPVRRALADEILNEQFKTLNDHLSEAGSRNG